MDKASVRDLIAVLTAALLLAQTGCAVRRGAQLAPTAAQPCPSWVEFPADTHSNADSAFLGCVNRENLTNMLERQEDLAHGRALGPARGERASSAVDAYNTGRTRLPGGTPAAGPTIVMPAAVGEGSQ